MRNPLLLKRPVSFLWKSSACFAHLLRETETQLECLPWHVHANVLTYEWIWMTWVGCPSPAVLLSVSLRWEFSGWYQERRRAAGPFCYQITRITNSAPLTDMPPVNARPAGGGWQVPLNECWLRAGPLDRGKVSVLHSKHPADSCTWERA